MLPHPLPSWAVYALGPQTLTGYLKDLCDNYGLLPNPNITAAHHLHRTASSQRLRMELAPDIYSQPSSSDLMQNGYYQRHRRCRTQST